MDRLTGWEAEAVDAAVVARLATVTPAGAPHVVPVCFARAGDEVFIAVDEKPKRPGELARIRNLRREPRAALLVDRYDDDWTCLAWVRLDCTAVVLDRGAHRGEALEALRARYAQYREMALESLPLIVLRVERVVSWRWTPAT